MGAFTIVMRNSKWRLKTTLSTITNIASRNRSAGSALHSIVADNTPHENAQEIPFLRFQV